MCCMSNPLYVCIILSGATIFNHFAAVRACQWSTVRGSFFLGGGGGGGGGVGGGTVEI